MRHLTPIRFAVISVVLLFTAAAEAQSFKRELKLSRGGRVEIVNPAGRVYVNAVPSTEEVAKMALEVSSSAAIDESDVKITDGENARIEVPETGSKKRVDISLQVPERTTLRITTRDGEVRVSGNLDTIQVETETGTIATDVPTDDLRYSLLWIESRPRFLADFEVEKVKERSAGKFGLKGKFSSTGKYSKEKGNTDLSSADETAKSDINPNQPGEKVGTGSGSDRLTDTEPAPEERSSKERPKKQKPESKTVSLNFTTARGIVLLNVPPNEVMSDLRERPLTTAAKSIIRSGDSVLTEAIRRASPKYFGDYMRTLPPARREPVLASATRVVEEKVETDKQAILRVTDSFNRAIAGLTAEDFDITEAGEPRQVLSAQPVTAPVNLVLLLDVSGSVDNYVNFIRKAARNFVDTVNGNDRVSLVIFNDDVKVLSGFSTDREKLSATLDTFDAGGGTAYYDAVAYTLADTLRPMRGERTAIVILTDGDDNRSFLPFDSLIGAIEESGALIYPLYVPSALVAAASANPNATVDPVRSRYTGLSQKAIGEGEKLAKISGGVYYPISQVSDIQGAYDDIVKQIRTAYSVTFRSATAADPQSRPSPRLKIRSKRPGTFVIVNSVAQSRSN